jgi:DNA-binding SARP family transcriptional activator
VEAPDRSKIEFRVFGGVEARRHGTAFPLGGRRQQALLALLLLDPGRPVSADRLIDELWSGEPPDGADVTLRSYVSRLRAALGDTVSIAVGAGGYAIEVGDDTVDARRFERLLHDGDGAGARPSARRSRARLGAALALWTGPPYGDIATDGALRVEAERLDELRLRALELRIEADLQLGAAADLVDELERLVREHPLRESYWRQLMLALYRAERQADALDAYHRARAALDEQLGLDPGPELEALQAAILRQDVPPVATAADRSTLPTPVSSFIGRAAEIADVVRLLGESRLVTLSGVGGVGKTRLAIEAARARMPEHGDGVTFVDLAPLAGPSLVAGHVAIALDIREQAGVSPVELLANHLRSADALLVLDNCEHVRLACAELATRLLSACPDLRLLATSREVLGIAVRSSTRSRPWASHPKGRHWTRATASRFGCSWPGPARRALASAMTTGPSRRSRGSAPTSMACPSASSSRPPGLARSPPSRSPRACRIGSGSWSPGGDSQRRAIERFARPWIGATTSSSRRNGEPSEASPSSRAGSRSMPLQPYASRATRNAPWSTSSVSSRRRWSWSTRATIRRGTASSKRFGSTAPSSSQLRRDGRASSAPCRALHGVG